ncbi:MAG: glycosyltransferase family 9 protein, partial [Planctomycetia bacterium]|nr:glycosyltransferase family 9 protein [Planctomycetia bacterium]
RQTWLDEVIEHDRRNVRTFADFIRRLRQRQWDVAVDFQGLLRSGLVTRLSGARRRIGFAPSKEHAHWFYNERVRLTTWNQHAVDRYYELAQHLGASLPGMPLARPYMTGGPPNPESIGPQLFPVHPTDEDRRQVQDWLSAQGFEANRQRLVAIHPHARRTANLWPTERFSELARQLAARDDLRVVLIGGPAASGMCDQIARGSGDRIWRADGRFSMLGSAELLSHTAVMVTGDTGPMHLAAAVGTPMVTLFGPTDPMRTGPYCTNAVVIDKRIPCGHCKGKHCPRHLDPPECLEIITVSEVAAAVERQLALGRPLISTLTTLPVPEPASESITVHTIQPMPSTRRREESSAA